jgi:hypothetical protein
VTFDPRDRRMSRNRGQVLYRFRPNQTFDHAGGYTAQVRQYGRDDAYQGPALDQEYLIQEAGQLVRRWRLEGQRAVGAEGGSDRAPEFPEDLPMAEHHYDVVIPGRVFCQVWPRMIRCAAAARCGLVWEAADPRPGVDEFPPPCPRCHNLAGNRQLQFVFVHQCGELQPMRPPRSCPRHHTVGFRLNDRVSRFKDFRWECLACGASQEVRAFCPNRTGCRWESKLMAPQVHTASAAFVGHGLTVVNPPREDFARLANTPAFVIGTLARWLRECTDDELARLRAGGDAAEVPPEVVESIREMEATGLPNLVERARALRRRFMPVDPDELRERVAKVLGYDPLGDDGRGRALARNLAVYERVLRLSRLTLEGLDANAASAGRASRYTNYRPTVRQAGFDPAGMALVNDFPVTYLAVGYSRGGFTPVEADLVAYKGRAGRRQAITNLLFANPTETEALTFVLDHDRVARWLIANSLAGEAELREAGGPHRWFAARLDPHDGQLPRWDAVPVRGEDAQFGAWALFGLLHTTAHQMLRALAVDSGFSETSLSEYLFPHDLAFAIHPNGGSEFTIGGLRTVLEQNLDEVVVRAVENSACIYDPNCMVANRGVDHGCLQLPETACQSWNRALSRWYLYGSPDRSWTGYWDPALTAP